MPGNELALLSCGKYDIHLNLNEVFQNLADKISKLENCIINLPSKDENFITIHGPFYGRSLIENVCTALVGRLDPYRLLCLKVIQQQISFTIDNRSNSAIKWNGDIFEKGLSDSEKQKMWDSNKKPEDISRGLFGDYYGEIYWKQSYQILLDETINYPGGDFLEEFRRETPPENFISRIRQNFSRLYSSLSKGIHCELIIRPDLIFDRTTVLELLRDTIKLCSIISLVSHKIDTSICKIEINEAISLYRTLKDRWERYGS